MLRKIPSFYYWATRVLRVPALWITRPHWRGGENFPSQGAFIAASNHVTTLDAITFLHFLVGHGVASRVLAKAELFKVPILGPTLKKAGMVAVYRGGEQATDALEAAYRALEGGQVISVFPEGTLTRDPNMWPMKGKTGLARMALKTKVPVIPVAQWGMNEALPRYTFRLRPFPRHDIYVVAGPPVDLSDLYDRADDHEAVREATARVIAAITDLLVPLRGEPAPLTVFDSKVDYDAGKKNLGRLSVARANLDRSRRLQQAAAVRLLGRQ